MKLPSEFLFSGLSESANYLKNRLISWAPKNNAAQYFRSGLLLSATGFQGLFKGLSLGIRTIASPLTSYRAAAKIDPALGILSAAVSTVAYTGLAVIAAPLALGALAGLGGSAALTPVISSLTLPLTTIMYAAVAALTGGAILAGIRKAVDAIVGSTSEKNASSNNIENIEGFDFSGISPVHSALGGLGGAQTEPISSPEPEPTPEPEPEHQKRNDESDNPAVVIKRTSH